MPTPVEIAARYIGVKESPAGSNCNPFSHRLGRGCEPWCADALVCFCDEAGWQPASRSAAVASHETAAHKTGAWHSTPQPGKQYAVVFNFPNEPGVDDHIGLAESWTGSTVTSIDGNTSINGSQSAGGEVQRRTRSRSLVRGWIELSPLTAPVPTSPATVTPGTPVEIDMQLTPYDVTFTSGASGEGNLQINVDYHKIVGFVPPGLRPNSDHKYLEVKVGFAPESDHTILSSEGWEPHAQETIRVWVAA